MDEWTSAKLCDVANLVLGMVLFFSPWLFGLAAGAHWQPGWPVPTSYPSRCGWRDG